MIDPQRDDQTPGLHLDRLTGTKYLLELLTAKCTGKTG